MYTVDDLPQSTSWIKSLTAAEAVAQISALNLLPASTLEENRLILKRIVQTRKPTEIASHTHSTSNLPNTQFSDSPSALTSVEQIPNAEVVQNFSPIAKTTQPQNFFISSQQSEGDLGLPSVIVSSVDQQITTTPMQFSPFSSIPTTQQQDFDIYKHLYTQPITNTTTVAQSMVHTPVSVQGVGDPRHCPAPLNLAGNTVLPDFTQQLTTVMTALHKQTLETIEACRLTSPSSNFHSNTNHTLTELIKPIPITTGTDNRQLIYFLTQVNNIVQLELVPDQEVILSLLPKTEGSLRVIWSDAVSTCFNWFKLKNHILNSFFPVRTLRSLINDSVYRLQRPDESFRDFANDIKQTIDLLMPQLSELEVVDTIMQAINPPTRAHLSMQSKPTSFTELETLVATAAEVANTYTEYEKTYGTNSPALMQSAAVNQIRPTITEYPIGNQQTNYKPNNFQHTRPLNYNRPQFQNVPAYPFRSPFKTNTVGETGRGRAQYSGNARGNRR